MSKPTVSVPFEAQWDEAKQEAKAVLFPDLGDPAITAALAECERRNKRLEPNQWRSEACDIWTFTKPTLLGATVCLACVEVVNLSDFATGSHRDVELRATFLAWHRSEYFPLLQSDECYPPGELPRKMTEDEIRMPDGSAGRMRRSCNKMGEFVEVANGQYLHRYRSGESHLAHASMSPFSAASNCARAAEFLKRAKEESDAKVVRVGAADMGVPGDAAGGASAAPLTPAHSGTPEQDAEFYRTKYEQVRGAIRAANAGIARLKAQVASLTRKLAPNEWRNRKGKIIQFFDPTPDGLSFRWAHWPKEAPNATRPFAEIQKSAWDAARTWHAEATGKPRAVDYVVGGPNHALPGEREVTSPSTPAPKDELPEDVFMLCGERVEMRVVEVGSALMLETRVAGSEWYDNFWSAARLAIEAEENPDDPLGWPRALDYYEREVGKREPVLDFKVGMKVEWPTTVRADDGSECKRCGGSKVIDMPGGDTNVCPACCVYRGVSPEFAETRNKVRDAYAKVQSGALGTKRAVVEGASTRFETVTEAGPQGSSVGAFDASALGNLFQSDDGDEEGDDRTSDVGISDAPEPPFPGMVWSDGWHIGSLVLWQDEGGLFSADAFEQPGDNPKQWLTDLTRALVGVVPVGDWEDAAPTLRNEQWRIISGKLQRALDRVAAVEGERNNAQRLLGVTQSERDTALARAERLDRDVATEIRTRNAALLERNSHSARADKAEAWWSVGGREVRLSAIQSVAGAHGFDPTKGGFLEWLTLTCQAEREALGRAAKAEKAASTWEFTSECEMHGREEAQARTQELETQLATTCAALTRMEARVRELEDCGQEGTCKLSPGCMRHFGELNRELVTKIGNAKRLATQIIGLNTDSNGEQPTYLAEVAAASADKILTALESTPDRPSPVPPQATAWTQLPSGLWAWRKERDDECWFENRSPFGNPWHVYRCPNYSDTSVRFQAAVSLADFNAVREFMGWE